MSGARPDSWMPFYIGDYLADTMHLNRDQHGAYLLLIFAYWRRGGPLPDDDNQLAAIARATVGEWRKLLRPILCAFFQIVDGLWHHKRIDAELARALMNSEERRKAGAKGAAKRWQTDSSAIVEPLANASQNDAPSQSQSQSQREREPPAGRLGAVNGASRATRLPADFTVPPDWLAEAEEKRRNLSLPPANLRQEAAQFVAWQRRKAAESFDWRQSWLSWALKAQADPGAAAAKRKEYGPL